MRNLTRALRLRFGISAQNVAVRAEIPWYWRVFWAIALLLLGFGLGYWRYASDSTVQLHDDVQRLEQENRQLRTQSIHVESQQQVTQVAQKDLAKDIAVLQEENVLLKEDVGFYKSILEDSSSVAVVKFHSFKVSKSSKAGEYQFRILLIQSGKHDKSVQGRLQLELTGTENGKSVIKTIAAGVEPKGSFKINFKYYQPVEGSFAIPDKMTVMGVQAKFFQTGFSDVKLTQTATLP
ncbi:MAG: DUF6776 family protein [Methylophilaceae bacterium]